MNTRLEPKMTAGWHDLPKAHQCFTDFFLHTLQGEFVRLYVRPSIHPSIGPAAQSDLSQSLRNVGGSWGPGEEWAYRRKHGHMDGQIFPYSTRLCPLQVPQGPLPKQGMKQSKKQKRWKWGKGRKRGGMALARRPRYTKEENGGALCLRP